MFHLLADDTGASAVWAAQRVPDDHITAVANQFVIGEIDLGDPTNFMASGREGPMQQHLRHYQTIKSSRSIPNTRPLRRSHLFPVYCMMIDKLTFLCSLTCREHLGRCHQNQAMGLRHCWREALQLRIHLREQQAKHGFRVH
jgi:Peptidase family C69